MKNFFLAFCLMLVMSGGAAASDYVALIGGGPTPYNSQVSIESNVIWTSGLIDHPEYADVVVLFASGPDRLHDVRYQVDYGHLEPHHAALTRIFGGVSPEFSRYRQNRVDLDILKADRQTVQTNLQTMLRSLKPDESLWIIYSGHGGWEDDGHNNTMRLWNEEKLTAQEFSDMLHSASDEVFIRFVLPQCHSGGFIDVLVNRLIANIGRDDSLPTVCGFASVPSEAVSEG